MSSAGGYFPRYKSLEPDPKHGPPDQATIALLHRFNVIAYTGAVAFLDIVALIRRLTPEGTLPPVPSEFYIFDHLYSHYSELLDVAVRTHAACAKYLLSCGRALAPIATDSSSHPSHRQMEPDILTALDEFGALCREVRTTVAEVIDCWNETASGLSDRDGSHLPILWHLLSSVAPDYAPIRRQTLLAAFPSLRAKGERNLHDFGDAYEGLEGTVAQIEAARASAPTVDVSVEPRRNLKIALAALVRLETQFRWYKSGLLVANGDWNVSVGNLLVDSLIASEKDWWS